MATIRGTEKGMTSAVFDLRERIRICELADLYRLDRERVMTEVERRLLITTGRFDGALAVIEGRLRRHCYPEEYKAPPPETCPNCYAVKGCCGEDCRAFPSAPMIPPDMAGWMRNVEVVHRELTTTEHVDKANELFKRADMRIVDDPLEPGQEVSRDDRADSLAWFKKQILERLRVLAQFIGGIDLGFKGGGSHAPLAPPLPLDHISVNVSIDGSEADAFAIGDKIKALPDGETFPGAIEPKQDKWQDEQDTRRMTGETWRIRYGALLIRMPPLEICSCRNGRPTSKVRTHCPPLLLECPCCLRSVTGGVDRYTADLWNERMEKASRDQALIDCRRIKDENGRTINVPIGEFKPSG